MNTLAATLPSVAQQVRRVASPTSLASPRLASPRLASPHLASPRLASPRLCPAATAATQSARPGPRHDPRRRLPDAYQADQLVAGWLLWEAWSHAYYKVVCVCVCVCQSRLRAVGDNWPTHRQPMTGTVQTVSWFRQTRQNARSGASTDAWTGRRIVFIVYYSRGGTFRAKKVQ